MLNSPELPAITVQQLAYLDAVVRARTWRVAADELAVTPSALSQGIAELERRLGVELFTAAGRRRVLRDDAVEVAAYAQRVLAQTRDLAAWIDAARDGRTGRLRVGLIDAAAVHHFATVLRAFRRTRPDLDLRLTVAPSGELMAALEQATLDLVVCVAPEVRPGWARSTELLDEPLVVVAPPGQRPDDPAAWGPWVTFPATSRTRALIERAVRAQGARFDVVAESHQPEVLREMVRLGVGWAVLPATGKVVDGPVLAHRQLIVLWRADGPQNPAATILRERLAAASGSRPVRRR